MSRTSTRPRRTSAYTLTGAFDLFPKSYKIVRKNLGVFALLYLFPFIIGLSNGILTIDNERNWHNDAPVAINAVGNSTIPAYIWGGLGLAFLFALAIGTFIQIMTHQAELEGSEHRKVKFGQLWDVVKLKGWQMFGLYLAVGAAILISLIPLVIYAALGLPVKGAVLFLFPAIIMLRRYFLSPYVLLDNDGIGTWEAMEKSAAMTQKHSRSIYSIVGVMLLISLAGIIPLIGWMISFPLSVFYSVAPALRYQELKKLG